MSIAALPNELAWRWRSMIATASPGWSNVWPTISGPMKFSIIHLRRFGRLAAPDRRGRRFAVAAGAVAAVTVTTR